MTPEGQDAAEVARGYADALLDIASRPTAAARILAAAHADGLAAREICTDVIPRALHEVGRRWQTGHASVAEEHLASRAAQEDLREYALRLSRRPRRGETVVVAAVDGELHELGARVLADLLTADGYDVLYVGAATPIDALALLVSQRRPEAVALSATLPTSLPTLVATVERLRADDMPPLFILVGGQACVDDDVAARSGADACVLAADDGIGVLAGRADARDPEADGQIPVSGAGSRSPRPLRF